VIPSGVRESELLEHIYGRSADLSRRFPQVLVGPGHDCAVVGLNADQVLLKVDQVVAGRHFREETPVDLIARKSVARAVSDLAAAGGTPLAALAAATLPANYALANALFDAMARWAAQFGCPLVGGDISATTGPLVLSVSIIGTPHPVRGPVLRSGAKAGDGVYVSGALGGSFDEATGLGRHLTFEPRAQEAQFLCDTLGGRLHAMMDVSDGLGRDSGRLARASNVGIVLQETAVPMSAGVVHWRTALGDGEDYELLFVATGSVPDACPATGTPFTKVGTVVEGSGTSLIRRDGLRVDVAELGWDHGMDRPRPSPRVP
jgi:thiamine-monophosphate kinase